MKKLAVLFVALCLAFAPAALAEELTPIRVGATPAPHAEILELIKDDMALLGYDLQIVEFTEYPLPNPALAAGEIEANYFQHIPYLDQYNVTVGEDEQLVAAIPVHYEPYGLYAGTVASIEEIPDGATISVTNDPSNETRALLLLQEAGLITLPEGASAEDSLTKLDIVENPKNLDILEIDASQLPSTLEDVAMAVINGNFAIDAGLKPSEDAVFLEPADSKFGQLYTNYVVVRPADAEADWLKALESCLYSEEVYNYILSTDGAVPTFTLE